MNVDRLVESCYTALPQQWKHRPWEYLNHGYAVLDSEDQLNAYIAAYGEMHVVKCRMAMQNFPFEELVLSRNPLGEITHMRQFEIFDWGCGQAIGSLVFIQMLYEREMLHGLYRVTLIEPSETALNRAENWTRQVVHAATEVRKINRYIPSNEDAEWVDVESSSTIAIHICSNILDIREVGLKWLAQTTSKIADKNIYICVGPQYGRGISRISDFHNYLGLPECFTEFAKYPCAYTSRTHHPFGIEAKCFIQTSNDSLNSQYSEQSQQTHIDEYYCGDECLKGILPDTVIQAYHNLSNACAQSSFELYLRPTLGIERPDFLMTHFDRGVVVVNVCNDISQFFSEYERVEAVKQALIDTYIKSLKIGTIINPATYNSIKVGLYFSTASPEDVSKKCEEYYGDILERWEENGRRGRCPQDPTQYLVKLYSHNSQTTLRNVRCQGFRNDFYQEIKDTIFGSWHSYSQGDLTLRLTNRQNALVENDSSRLRIKGVAGCGKTQIVAHKAVKEHIRTGTKVLIVTYNIALIQYIKMRINQVPADFSTDAFEIINYHQFFISKARRYSGNHIPFGASDSPNFFDNHVEAIKKNHDQYDTIIVDEAQDYLPAWFDTLRKYFLTERGRIILVGDGEQNIYSREVDSATRMPRVNAFGQNNPWRNVSQRVSMRVLNPQIAILSSRFANEFNISTESITVEENLNLFDYKMGYWPVDTSVNPEVLAGNIEWIIRQYNLNRKDVVVLGQSINLLREVDHQYRSQYCPQTMTTFESKVEYEQVKSRTSSPSKLELDLKAIRRVAKVHFTTDVDIIKFATIQSFKGWESKTIILLIQSERLSDENTNEDEYAIKTRQNIPAHIYTAITRARENLFILNMGNDKYHTFFSNRIQND